MRKAGWSGIGYVHEYAQYFMHRTPHQEVLLQVRLGVCTVLNSSTIDEFGEGARKDGVISHEWSHEHKPTV